MRRATMSSHGKSAQRRPSSAREKSLLLPSVLLSSLLLSFLVICGCGGGAKLVAGIPVDAGAAAEVAPDGGDDGGDDAGDDAGDVGGAEDGTISTNDGGAEPDASNPDTQ